MEHAGEILILTGPPGSGKTTAALALTEQPGSAKVHLHTDDFCIVGPRFLPSFQTIATPVHYLVLRPSLALAIAHCQQRGNDTLTDPEPIAALHQQFSLLGELEHHVLSVDGKTRQETLEMVISAMQIGMFRL